MCVSYKIPLGYPGHVSAQVSQMTEACYTDIPVLLGETLLWGRGCTVLVQLQDHSAVKRGSDRNQLLQTFFILPPQILIPSLCPFALSGTHLLLIEASETWKLLESIYKGVN